MIEINPVKNKYDYLQIEQLANTIWREHYIPIVGKPQIDYMLDKYQSAKAISEQIAHGFEYFTTTFNQIPMGYFSIKQEKEYLFLSKIYILKNYRGKGIGKIMMTSIEEKSKVYNLNKVRLTVNIHNSNSIKAYEKLGFTNVGALVTDIGNGFVMDDYVMEKAF